MQAWSGPGGRCSLFFSVDERVKDAFFIQNSAEQQRGRPACMTHASLAREDPPPGNFSWQLCVSPPVLLLLLLLMLRRAGKCHALFSFFFRARLQYPYGARKLPFTMEPKPAWARARKQATCRMASCFGY
jgi:hypothetical protein